MPFIRMSTNIDINADRDARLRSGLGRAIELIPGKTERWLMIEIADNARLGLGGDKDTPAAIFTLKAFGKEQSNECYYALTEKVSALCHECLGISPDRVYIEYEVTGQWGWNGRNFGR